MKKEWRGKAPFKSNKMMDLFFKSNLFSQSCDVVVSVVFDVVAVREDCSSSHHHINTWYRLFIIIGTTRLLSRRLLELMETNESGDQDTMCFLVAVLEQQVPLCTGFTYRNNACITYSQVNMAAIRRKQHALASEIEEETISVWWHELSEASVDGEQVHMQLKNNVLWMSWDLQVFTKICRWTS